MRSHTPGDLDTYQSLTVGCGHSPFRWTNRFRLWAEFGHLFTALDSTIVPASGVLGFLPSAEDPPYSRGQLQFGY